MIRGLQTKHILEHNKEFYETLQNREEKKKNDRNGKNFQ